MTGSGTFESYINVGAGCAATPDGRLSGQPTASDVSPQPFAQVSVFTYICYVNNYNIIRRIGLYQMWSHWILLKRSSPTIH